MGKPHMEVGDIISYHDLAMAEKASLQKAMKFTSADYAIASLDTLYRPISLCSKTK